MALVEQGYEITVTLVDTGGNISNRTYVVSPDTATAPDVIASAIITRLDALTDAVVKSYRVAQVFIEDALVLPADAEVENLASIVAQIQDNPLKKANVLIPAPIDGLFVAATGPNYNVVNTSLPALTTYLNLWGTDQFLVLSDGEYIETPALSGKRIHRASRKG